METNVKKLVFVIALLSVVALSSHALADRLEDWERGDDIVAERFVVWAERALADGQLAQARATLERAGDFADVSSDVSYLTALVRDQNNESRFLVLRDLEKAIEVNRWRRYDEAGARLLQAGQLVRLRRFAAAIDALDIRLTLTNETFASSFLRLQALKGLALANLDFQPSNMPVGPLEVAYASDPPATSEFRRSLLETMDRSPRDSGPVRLLFAYAGQRVPNADDLALVEIALRRLPFLLDADPELAWMAAPFIGDLDEARRLVLAYRAGSFGPSPGFSPNPASIAVALNLGLLDDISAVDEFFAPGPNGELVLDKDLIISVADFLRGDEARDRFAQGLHSFTGVITVDENRDGIPESRVFFRDGVLLSFRHDADQDGVDDLTMEFDTGLPGHGELAIMPGLRPSGVPFDYGIANARIVWDRYPLVREVALANETFFFPPAAFVHGPIRFLSIGASETYAGLSVPVVDYLSQGLTRFALAMSAGLVERPSPEFADGIERLHLRDGLPVLSETMAGGVLISVIEFEDGLPVIQRLDLNRDGRMETVRRFRPGTFAPESSISDWSGDGYFDYVEVYPEDGSVVRN